MLVRWWAVGAASLVACTWRLWTPLRTPPCVPAMDFLAVLPPGIDFPLLVAFAIGLVIMLAKPGNWRAMLLATASLAGLMLLDQLRWQPWAYQLLLVGLGLSLLPWPGARRWLRVLMVSVLLYAAAAKLDTVFAHTIGQQMVDALGSITGANTSQWSENVRVALAMMMPVCEAVVGLLLAWPGSRRIGVIAAILLHGTILLALSPLGLDHQTGVLVWNAFSAGLLAILFWPREALTSEPASGQDTTQISPTAIAIKTLLVLAILAPLLSPFGFWDRWPSWGLYAPRGERARVWVHERAVERLPNGIPLRSPQPDGPWRQVRIDEWILNETAAPRYPQNRVAVAIALTIEEQAGLGAYLRVDLDSAAGRLDSTRERLTLEGADAVRDYASEHYWLSTKSRWSQ